MSDIEHKAEDAVADVKRVVREEPSRLADEATRAESEVVEGPPAETTTVATRHRGVPWWLLLVIALAALVLGFLIASLIANIAGKKAEANLPRYAPVVQVNNDTFDPAVWGQNFPNQYNGWAGTADFKPSLRQTLKLSPADPLAVVNPAGLNSKPNADSSNNVAPVAASPATTDAIPRDWVTPEKIVQDPRLITMWNGYAFAIDYRHLRGHEYMQTDQRDTLRVSAPPKSQPGACMNCHVSMPGVLSILGNKKVLTTADFAPGNADMKAAFDQLNSTKYLAPAKGADGKPSATLIDPNDPNGTTGLYGMVKAAGMDKPLSCVDCHDPGTMQLRVTRPAFINGIAALKASQGIQNYNVNKDATTQEMRTFVCAQCHVEYYFAPAAPAGKELPAGALKPNTLVFPWTGGTDIDSVYAYYMDPANFPATGARFTDFTNALTGGGIIKAQHPEFEAWSEGVHAANGVTCADCHMSYQRVGNQKVSNHDVASPMNDIAGTCGTCHTASEAVLKNQVMTTQSRFVASRDQALDALTQFIAAIKAAKDAGASKDIIDKAILYQNKASFYVDYGYSENSYGFHAPDYFQRIFMESIDASRQGQLVLMGVDPNTLAPSEQTTNNQQKTGG